VGEQFPQDRGDRVLTRHGTAVRHPPHPWSAATHALLTYLEDVGFPYSPRIVGMDRGDHLLGFIDGESGAEGWAPAVSEHGLAAAARLLRSYHDAVSGWRADIDLLWFDGSRGTGGTGQIVCHGDFYPCNIVWNGLDPVGLLDFEYARVGQRLDDVAYACEYFVPFRDDAECLRWLRYPEPPDRRRRLLAFAQAYGLPSADGLVDHVIRMQQFTRDLVERLARQGLPRQADLVAAGFLEQLDARINWSVRHRALIDPA
jgi:Phosphotransferase enzyme family